MEQANTPPSPLHVCPSVEQGCPATLVQCAFELGGPLGLLGNLALVM